jgi:predicted NBD/HSP70 family sugar kinase
MAGRTSTTVRDLRRTNSAAALWELYLRGPLTRQQIGEATAVSLATVSNVIGQLIRAGAVMEVGLEDSNGGRPRALVQVNPEHGTVIGVDIGETEFLVELYDLGMTVLASHRSSTQLHQLDPVDAVTHVFQGIDAVIEAAAADHERILGIGIGVPGVVEHATGDRGAVVHGQSIGWDAVPFERLMSTRTELPLLIDNGAKTLGQAETWFGAARDIDNAIVTLLGVGVGTSIISDRELYRGATSSAGEWGHTTIVADGRPCRCGSLGCLEAYIGAGALADRYDELAERRSRSDPGALEPRITRMIAARGSDDVARRVLEEATGYLGIGVANLVNLFNPERVVVGGWLGRALDDDLLDQVRASASRNALRLPMSHVEIVRAQLGADAVALGAATLPIAEFLSSGAIRAMRPSRPPSPNGRAATG